ncbi:MAG: BrnT family toxin [Acidobacteriota bacterium]
MKFDWNPDKAASNVEKHDGITFEEASEVFDDDYAVVELDRRHSVGEHRYRIIGASSTRLLFVIYTEREGDVTWIISAREAEDRERRKYYED